MPRMSENNSFVKSIISTKNYNQTSSQKFYFSLHKTNSKKIGQGSLCTKLLRDTSIPINLKYTDKSLLTLGSIITVSDKIIKNRKNNK